jgi:hypothetical protein
MTAFMNVGMRELTITGKLIIRLTPIEIGLINQICFNSGRDEIKFFI